MFVWLSNENVRDILGLSATITTVLQFLTGCLICRNYIAKKSTGEVRELCESFLKKFNVFFLFLDFITSFHIGASFVFIVATLWSPYQGKYGDSGQCNWRFPFRPLLYFLLCFYR
jgi:hypothetical protein